MSASGEPLVASLLLVGPAPTDIAIARHVIRPHLTQ